MSFVGTKWTIALNDNCFGKTTYLNFIYIMVTLIVKNFLKILKADP